MTCSQVTREAQAAADGRACGVRDGGEMARLRGGGLHWPAEGRGLAWAG